MPSIYRSVAYWGIDLVNDLAQVVDQRIGAIRLGARRLSVQGFGDVAVYNTDKAGASKSVVDSKNDSSGRRPTTSGVCGWWATECLRATTR